MTRHDSLRAGHFAPISIPLRPHPSQAARPQLTACVAARARARVHVSRLSCASLCARACVGVCVHVRVCVRSRVVCALVCARSRVRACVYLCARARAWAWAWAGSSTRSAGPPSRACSARAAYTPRRWARSRLGPLARQCLTTFDHFLTSLHQYFAEFARLLRVGTFALSGQRRLMLVKLAFDQRLTSV
jgi:hypothetical protein